MRDLTTVAQRLRAVWQARRHFLKLAAAEREFIEPMLDRIVEDLGDDAAPDQASPAHDNPDGSNSSPEAHGREL